jgi:hopene-associated glycosyltransferase HpnB
LGYPAPMPELVLTLAFLSLAAWLVQLLARGGFWRADQRLPETAKALERWPAVRAVVPARNEAEVIEHSVASLLAQDYPGSLAVVVVDDRSDDGTAGRARAVARRLGAEERLVVVSGMPLPQGWTGKMWAVEQGVRQAAAFGEVPYLLLTDADIAHDPGNLRRLVAKAEHERLDLVSLMVQLHCKSLWERLLIPPFVFFFQMLYPFPLVNRRGGRTAAAAGGCMLVRSATLERVGGIAAIRSAIIDDCALARMIKSQGGAIWLGLTETVRSIRPYDRLDEIWRMVARSAYTQLNYSPVLLLGTVIAMVIVYLAPPLLVLVSTLGGHWLDGAPALLAWAIMAFAYRPTLALYDEPVWRAALLPVAGAFYLAMTVDSALRHWRGQGGAWKGRTYARDPRSSR